MATVLLCVIYLAFISLGLPDSVLGTAWPMMHIDLDSPVSMAGAVNVIISLCTVVSSLNSARLIKKMGTWGLTSVSIVLTFIALFLFSISQSIWATMLFSIPLGLGAGAIDTALNNYVAKHYSAMQMNLLHAFWGIGTVVAPILLSRFFETGHSWREGYVVLGTIQSSIFLIVLLSRHLWKKNESGEKNAAEEVVSKDRAATSPIRLLGVRGVLPSCLAFMFYTFEGVVILWTASYLVYGKGLDAASAASLSSMIYFGITGGRIASAFIANRVPGKTLIISSQIMIVFALLALAFTESTGLLYAIIFILGFSFGPIYPAMVKQTVSYFHPSYSVGVISLQMSFCYIGNMIIPPLYGILARVIGRQDILPWYVLVLVLLMSACTFAKNRLCGK